MKFITLILFLLFFQAGFAQNDTGYVFIRSFTGDVADVAIDNLDQLYVISSNGQVRKFNSKGDSIAIYNQVRNFGKLHSIDISNPLRPVLFYKDFSTVVVLDRFLAQRSVLDLRKVNIYQPSAAGLSYDNHLWIFDEFDNKLKKVDDQGNILMSTPDFRMVFNESIRPTRIFNESGSLYLADTTKGVYVFDNYGTFRKRLPVTHWNSISIRADHIIYTSENQLNIYKGPGDFDTKKPFPATNAILPGSFISPGRLVLFSSDSLHIYQLRY